jgi:hypothetical protein
VPRACLPHISPTVDPGGDVVGGRRIPRLRRLDALHRLGVHARGGLHPTGRTNPFRSREPAVEEGPGGGGRERARGARPSVSEAPQPQTLTGGDYRGHLRSLVILVLQLPGDE